MKSLKTELGVWPFDGDLGTLIADRACVIVETYPAEACVQLGLPAQGRKWSKRKQVNALAALFLDDGDLGRGIELLERAIELDRRYVAAHRNLGEAYLRAGRASEGEKELALAEELER